MVLAGALGGEIARGFLTVALFLRGSVGPFLRCCTCELLLLLLGRSWRGAWGQSCFVGCAQGRSCSSLAEARGSVISWPCGRRVRG